jgi:hypothetical protein
MTTFGQPFGASGPPGASVAERIGYRRRVTSHSPLLLLDVDGVLNPFAAAERPPGYAEHTFFPGEDPAEAWDWADARDLPTLLIDVDPAEGLTLAVVERLMAWARSLDRAGDGSAR